MATHARARLLDTAEALFYAEGIRAVGVERILAESGVGRASFYRHFTGKDALVVAVLTRRDRAWRDWLADRVTALGGRPLDVFDALAERFARADFRGCAFINTMVETADPDSPAHRVAAAHKQQVVDYVAALLADRGHPADRAAALAHRIVLLMDGAIVTALREGTPAPAAEARTIAAALLAAEPPGPGLEDPCAEPAARG
ncbi:TetR family transcriptional regulator [Kitasatospora phosalacinea]|uniref:TetR family transcriptional regulator n=1 Tax=Kitasatospora phosalacinea TaxID=2065 RepID=A0A9W6Q525_9ACTN|nr:TetR/AcrR family transcriptional regulator [Kitasatospora phosalacinea]GLW68573.1 TetR family transcriptional regulator [Kitasatospora phosalacinea]